MAKRVAIPYKDVKLRIVGPKGDFYAHRVQRLDMPANMPSTVINELGNSLHAGTVTDVPEVTSTFQAFDVSHKIYAYMVGQNPSDYATQAWDSTTGVGEGGVDVKNLSYCDLIAYIKTDGVADVVRCMHVKYMRVTDFTYTYSVDGESTEEYSLAGSEKRYFSSDLFVNSGTIQSNAFTLAYTPTVLRNGNKLLSFIVDGIWIEEGVESDEYSVVGQTVSYIDSNGTTCLAVYQCTSGSLVWTDISDNTVPIAIRGKNIPVYIQASDDEWEKQYRVQSVNIRGTFPNTKVMEMGNTSVVGYIVDPCDVTGDISILDHDLDTVKLLTTGDKVSALTEFGVDDYEDRTLTLRVEVQSPGTFGGYSEGSVTKTVRIPSMRITSEGTSTNVGGQSAQTFSFSSDDGQCIVYSGAYTG